MSSSSEPIDLCEDTDDEVGVAGSASTAGSSATGSTDEKVWSCDICKVAEFGTYDEAVQHERICAETKDTDTDDDIEYVPTSTNPSPATPVSNAAKAAAATNNVWTDSESVQIKIEGINREA